MSKEPYDRERIAKIDDPGAFRYCSGEELRTYLSASPDWRVADFGSGTGRFTSELAPIAETVYAIDVRPGMHAVYREKGMPSNVTAVTSDFRSLPFPDDHLDGAVSMRSYHHGFQPALEEVARVIRPGGRLVIVDWSATGAGDRDAHDEEEYLDLSTVQSHLLDAGFSIATAIERRETFVVVGSNR
ncbi:MAG: class I SAM-dependent methyltransferase [Halobacteriota archaeon]